MIYDNLTIEHFNTRILSKITGNGPYKECHLVVTSIDRSLPLSVQLANADRAIDLMIKERPGDRLVPVFKRYYLSDPANQACFIPKGQICAVSVVGQSPLDYSKFCLLAILQSDADACIADDGLFGVNHSGYTEYWLGGASYGHGDSYDATHHLFGRYDELLRRHGCSLADNCLRTWLFVRDIDNHYKGVVNARNDYFARVGLAQDTHFIASTGIEGDNPDPRRTVTFDAYAIDGIAPADIRYLHAYDHLNPTAEYGVAFERGTAVTLPCGVRRIIISGTASINNKGEIVYPGDIVRQTYRMLENVAALLDEGGCSLSDLSHAVVYLRDPSDYSVVKGILSESLSKIPHILVKAPVCRPGWLIEMECMAIV